MHTITSTARVMAALGVTAGSLLAASGAASAAETRPPYTESCTATPVGGNHGSEGYYIGDDCRIDPVWDELAYAGVGTWRLELLRDGKQPGGEWLDVDGAVVTDDTPERPVVRTRIVLTSDTAMPVCGSAIETGDTVIATVEGPSSAITLQSGPGGGFVEATAINTAFPGDHRSCLKDSK
jgi:hypothetical protein